MVREESCPPLSTLLPELCSHNLETLGPHVHMEYNKCIQQLCYVVSRLFPTLSDALQFDWCLLTFASARDLSGTEQSRASWGRCQTRD
ncbi:hypothetical protein PoB_005110300 [Plakobranchus ocellatus]|uniref:Uncharacterized protein n=1 Tax=Plakobranchus ocellatus TaxID=259542 RepID=A0AAV4C0J4_9GAST|nr:hypothetical protein PoB_005110300 [Plakobranchus ocellatus]